VDRRGGGAGKEEGEEAVTEEKSVAVAEAVAGKGNLFSSIVHRLISLLGAVFHQVPERGKYE
jgi:hypothetical protein